MAEIDYSDDIAVVIPFAPSYSITPSGVITRIKGSRTYPAGYVLKPSRFTRTPYKRVVIVTVDGPQTWQLHRLLAYVFHGPPPAGKELACHIDGDAEHNHARNIRWGSPSDNMLDKVAHGNSGKGAANPRAILSAETVVMIRKLPYRRGMMTRLAVKYGVTKSTISKLYRGDTWS